MEDKVIPEVMQCYKSLVENKAKFLENWEAYQKIHVEELRALTESAKNADSELLEGVEETRTLGAQLQENEKKDAALAEDARILRSKSSDMKSQNNRMQSELDAKTAEFEKLKSSNDVHKIQIEKKRIFASANSELCRRMLGLEILTLKGNRMQFVFRNLCVDKPDEFGFIIIGLNEDTYSVMESHPDLEDLSSLEMTLNKVNDLAGFLQHSRRLLKAKLKELD